MEIVKRAADWFFNSGYLVTASFNNESPPAYVRYATMQDRSDSVIGDGIELGVGARVCDREPTGGTFCTTYIGASFLSALCHLDWSDEETNFKIIPVRRKHKTTTTYQFL